LYKRTFKLVRAAEYSQVSRGSAELRKEQSKYIYLKISNMKKTPKLLSQRSYEQIKVTEGLLVFNSE